MEREIQGREGSISIHIFLGLGRDAYKMVGCYLYTLAGTEDLSYGLIKRLRILF